MTQVSQSQKKQTSIDLLLNQFPQESHDRWLLQYAIYNQMPDNSRKALALAVERLLAGREQHSGLGDK